MNDRECPFCYPDRNQIIHEGKHVIALWDDLPVSPGHALLVPKRHVGTWFDATSEERFELLAVIDIVRDTIVSHYQPDGFNVGIDIGEAAGQEILHVHLHVIPRYRDDLQGSTGGLRHVIPLKGQYGKKAISETSLDAEIGLPLTVNQTSFPTHSEPLICGGEDPLLPHLLANLDCAERTDMAVAFVLESGVEVLEEHLRDLLDRGARIRLLTGDYLGITDPRALYRLMDLQEGGRGQLDLRIFESGGISFHPKAYIFYFKDPATSGIAYVGSSNLSAQALGEGIEWNYRIIPAETRKGFQSVVDAFERLFKHPKSRPIDTDWIHGYQSWRKPPCIQAHTGIISEETQLSWRQPPSLEKPAEVLSVETQPPPKPHKIQDKALDAFQ